MQFKFAAFNEFINGSNPFVALYELQHSCVTLPGSVNHPIKRFAVSCRLFNICVGQEEFFDEV